MVNAATPMTENEVVTLGCRLNASEADAIAHHALAAGLSGGVVVNTCAVTAEAVRQAAQLIRRTRRERADARIIVTGCAAQIEPERFAAMPEVDHVIGNSEKLLPQTYRTLSGPGPAPRVSVGDIMSADDVAGPMVELVTKHPRAFLQVQNGCDHRCTFCTIPFGRGRARSLPVAEVVERARRLVESGVPEIVVTGVDVTAWGDDLPERPRLGSLLRQILDEVPELARLRLSSIDQTEADPELLDLIAGEPRLMPHLHLSLQSGNDLILKRMRRRHSRAEAVAFCNRVRRLRPDIAIGADLIAGFPTESEAHFRDTLSIVEECGLAFLHVFPYSARKGTPAARMPPVQGDIIRERASRLRERGQSVLKTWLASHVGRPIQSSLERSGTGPLPARTPQFAPVLLSGVPADWPAGRVVTAQVVGHDGRRLLAEALT